MSDLSYVINSVLKKLETDLIFSNSTWRYLISIATVLHKIDTARKKTFL